MKDIKEKVPQQQEGAKSDIRHAVNVSTNDEAAEVYERARRNLLAINRWQSLAGKLSARFILTDNRGNEVERDPLKGDYIKIHLPSSREDKFDWVRIESIEEQRPDDYTSRIRMTVRPSDPPMPQDQTEHFFSKEATSNFFVERKGRTISAMVKGRNELPNVNTSGILNKIRNAVVAVAAMAGLNVPQWKALAQGILEKSS